MGQEQPKGYEVRVRRDGRFWLVEIPSLDGMTQARRLDEVDAMAREYIALVTDDESPVELDVHVELPDDVRALVAHVAALREEAERMQRQATAEAVEAAVRLKDDGLTVREVGRALGVSHQRAQQLVTGAHMRSAITGRYVTVHRAEGDLARVTSSKEAIR